MKKILGTCLSGLAVALLLVVGGAAQENFVIGGVAGVCGLHGHAMLPPAVIFLELRLPLHQLQQHYRVLRLCNGPRSRTWPDPGDGFHSQEFVYVFVCPDA